MLSFIFEETKKLYNKKFKFLKNKNILITGASGLIGHYLICFFLHNIDKINSLKKLVLVHKSKLPPYFKILNKYKKIKIIKLDLSKKENNKINMKFDYIFHLASYGQPSKFIHNPLETFKLNTHAIINLIKNLKSNGNFFYLSSSEIYSGLKGNIKEDKIGTINTDHARGGYIFGKLAGETLLSIFRKIKKLEYKIIRLCLAYGPGTKINDTRVLNQFIENSFVKKKIQLIDDGKDIRKYIYITDALKMILNICFFGKNHIYNVGGKKRISINKLANVIGKIQNRKVIIKKNYNEKKSSPKNAFVNINKYEKEFGIFKMTQLEKGIKNTIDWQKKIYEKKIK
jgi:UDP-glucuronate decarboxylase